MPPPHMLFFWRILLPLRQQAVPQADTRVNRVSAEPAIEHRLHGGSRFRRCFATVWVCLGGNQRWFCSVDVHLSHSVLNSVHSFL